MPSKVSLPGQFDLSRELGKIADDPNWELVHENHEAPLFVFSNSKTYEMRCFGDPEAIRIAESGYNRALQATLRESKGFGHLVRRKTRK